MNRAEATVALALVSRTFTELVVHCMRDPVLCQKLEHLGAALTLATSAVDAVPKAEVVAIGGKKNA